MPTIYRQITRNDDGTFNTVEATDNRPLSFNEADDSLEIWFEGDRFASIGCHHKIRIAWEIDLDGKGKPHFVCGSHYVSRDEFITKLMVESNPWLDWLLFNPGIFDGRFNDEQAADD